MVGKKFILAVLAALVSVGATIADTRAATPAKKIFFDPYREVCELEGNYSVSKGKTTTAVSTLVYNPRTKNAFAWTSADTNTDILPVSGILAHVVKNACMQHVNDLRQQKIEKARKQLARAEELRNLALSKRNHDIKKILANFHNGQSIGQPSEQLQAPANFVTAAGPALIPVQAKRETFVDKLHRTLNNEQNQQTAVASQATAPKIAPTVVPATTTQTPGYRLDIAPEGTRVAALSLPRNHEPQRAIQTQAPNQALPQAPAKPAKSIPSAGAEHAFLMDQLRKGLSRALDLSHDIQSAKHHLTAAQHALTATKNTKYNPEVSLVGFAGAGLGLKDDKSRELDGISEKASAALKVSMNLLDGGKSDAEYNLATVGIRESSLSVLQARTQILSAVRQSFWRWQLAEAHKRTIKRWRRPFKQWLRSAHRLFAEQMITAKDLLFGESVDSLFDEQLETLDQNIKVHHVVWKTLTGGAPLKTTNALWPELPAIPSSTAFEKGLDSSISVEQAKAAIEAETHKMKIAEADSKTKLGLETTGQKNRPGDASLFVGVRFKIPLYDRGVQDSRMRESRSKLAAARKRLDAVRQNVRLQLIQLSSKLELSQRVNLRQTAALSASLAKLQNVKTLYEKLPGKLPELFQAVGGYLNAVQSSSAAMNEYFTTYNSFLQTVGAETVTYEES